jgi:hypothetical protein
MANGKKRGGDDMIGPGPGRALGHLKRAKTEILTDPGSPENPGQVTDLTHVDAGVLNWTEVDDGTGNPAKYAIRFGSPTITGWAAAYPTEVAITEGQTGIGETFVYDTGQTSGDYEYQLITYRGTLDVDAVFGLHSNVEAFSLGGALVAGTVTAEATGATTVDLTSGVASGGTGPYTYQWHRDTSPGFTPSGANDIVGFTSLTETDTGLDPETTYYYKVVATDDVAATATSNEVSATTDADSLVAGTATAASAGETSVSLSATVASGGTAPYTYQWHFSTSPGFTPSGGNAIAGFTSLSETHTGRTTDVTYYYKLVATDDVSATATSNETSATPSASNEPAGYAVIGEHTFSTKEEGGWNLPGAGANLTIQTDATEPESPPNVGRVLFGQGLPTSGSLIPVSLGKTGWSSADFYFRFSMKYSANWQGHSSGVNKVFYWTDSSSGGGGDPLICRCQGSDAGDMNFQVVTQNPDLSPVTVIYRWDSAGNGVSPSLADATIDRDTWYVIEVLIRANTPGSADGEIHVWIDGTKILEFTNVEMVSPDSDGTFDNCRGEPVWGGSGDSVEEDMYLYWGHFYLSTP